MQTSNKSVAGRGAFYVSQDATNTIQQGDVLAYVPKTTILTLSNPTSLSSLGDDNDDNDEEASRLLKNLSSLPSSSSSWPVSFTLFVGAVASKNGIFSKWIDRFMGPQPPSPTNDNDVHGQMFHKRLQQRRTTLDIMIMPSYEIGARQKNEWKIEDTNNHIMSESLFGKVIQYTCQ